jgi:HlyD family secretion protein
MLIVQIKKFKKPIIVLVIIFFIVLSIFFVGRHNKKLPQNLTRKTMIVKLEPFSARLFFTANVQPFKVSLVTSPVDGTVVTRNFEYGGSITKDQLLFTIHSPQLQNDYTQALMSFLRAKQSYLRSNSTFSGTKELWAHGLVSEEEYNNDRDALVSSRLEYLQNKGNLKNFYENEDEIEKLDKVSISDIPQFEKLFQRSIQNVEVKSPTSGLALFPEATQGSEKTQKIVVGNEVKKAQALVSIGDLEGITLLISASEIHINEIKVNQKVTISGPAFPDIKLDGKIVDVGFQATDGSSYGDNSVAKFPVKIVVNNLSEEQRELIHIGMTATVEIDSQPRSAIMLPLTAINYNNKSGQDEVWVIDPKTRAVKTVNVLTGPTTTDQVVIDKGLEVGDEVVLP